MSRIFPNNLETPMGSKIQFSGIDWDEVEKNISSNKYASNNSVEIIEMIKNLTGVPEEKIESIIHTAKEIADESDLNDNKKTDKPEFDEPEHADEPEKVEASNLNTMKKIAFTHPNQISAEAIEAAKAKGDEKLVNTILAARKENRLRIAKAISAKIKEANTKPATTSSEDNVFMNFNQSQLNEMMKSYASQNLEAPEGLKLAFNSKNLTKQASDISLKFSSPTEFTRAQRLAFNNVALSLGMPKEYVEAMAPLILPKEVEALNTKIREVYSSDISKDTKSSVIDTLIKEAKLSNDSKSEFINYWNNVLGYQDKEFWPLVAADYESGKKVD
jgi:hypothetical protein